jgi:hypothetical protein
MRFLRAAFLLCKRRSGNARDFCCGSIATGAHAAGVVSGPKQSKSGRLGSAKATYFLTLQRVKPLGPNAVWPLTLVRQKHLLASRR